MEVIFHVQCRTSFGQQVWLVGSTETFGQWDSSKAMLLETTPDTYPQWRSKPVMLHEHDSIEYKYILVEQNGSVQWEECKNRQILYTQVASDEVVLVKNRFGTQHDEDSVCAVPKAALHTCAVTKAALHEVVLKDTIPAQPDEWNDQEKADMVTEQQELVSAKAEAEIRALKQENASLKQAGAEKDVLSAKAEAEIQALKQENAGLKQAEAERDLLSAKAEAEIQALKHENAGLKQAVNLLSSKAEAAIQALKQEVAGLKQAEAKATTEIESLKEEKEIFVKQNTWLAESSTKMSAELWEEHQEIRTLIHKQTAKKKDLERRMSSQTPRHMRMSMA
eukprot:gnl/MRDRNA2_/MRDRNA2_127782_c0_seq1.p1 gnl/MRDRNA2_/MRDRNA2_127782_c0~~gnl/MRDRNA2_/MRDRNA2_127782_c0_seq1.p1  ORF type:complete len:336 (-),score=102.33 gnl/MRDRNA2_/MRDRNA2_127782_c0_seq1:191-1198(-)